MSLDCFGHFGHFEHLVVEYGDVDVSVLLQSMVLVIESDYDERLVLD
jgi:hypothetical protein